MKFGFAALALGLVVSTPAAAARFELIVQGSLLSNPVGANPLNTLPFGTGSAAFARWVFDINAATPVDAVAPIDASVGQARFWVGAVTEGQIAIATSTGGFVTLDQNANSFGSIFLLNDARTPNINARIDQVIYTDSARFDAGGVTGTYAIGGDVAPDVFLASVGFGRIQSTTLPVLPTLISSVDRPDLLALFSSGIDLFSLNFRQGSATSGAAAAALPTRGFNIVNRTIFINELTTVPEPQSWAMLIVGFGLVGAVMRRRAAALA